MKFLCTVLLAGGIVMSAGGSASASSQYDLLSKAYSLYEAGLYSSAANLLQNSVRYGDNAEIDGLAVLCAMKMRQSGYEVMADNYLKRYGGSVLYDDVVRLQAYDFFDKKEYGRALECFNSIPDEDLDFPERAEFVFKQGYCRYKCGNEHGAVSDFASVCRMEQNDYTAPSEFMTGYIRYKAGKLEEAIKYFGQSSDDERIAPIASYYLVACHFGMGDYDYVLENGVPMYDAAGGRSALAGDLPEDRKAHLARMISESYLVGGDKENAGRYYALSDDGTEKSRSDYFYAGSLMFTTGRYEEAIDNYSKMNDKSDSLGQIAWYQTALSYINVRNKVAALDAFKCAASSEFDPKMTEDAAFNHAKLAFDLNRDTAPFNTYMKKYSDKVRGEKIYSYMALASLSDRDYESAIEAYDRIEYLEGAEKNNYVHVNYLRGAELLDNGSYRRAVECMKAVVYYTPKNDRINQLARYSLGEAYYRNGQYTDAAAQFVQLYNNSALYGLEQGKLIPYNAAYSFFRQGDYPQARKWFDVYCAEGGESRKKDAMTRSADCLFAEKDYKGAAAAYQAVTDSFYDVNDIYPYYQCAIAYGLSKDSRKKIEVLSKVRTADSTATYYAEALFELGNALQADKKTAEALAVFKQIENTAPAGPYVARAVLEAGTIMRNSGNVEGALTQYRKVVETMPESGCVEDALLAIESIYQSANEPQKYIAYIDSIGKGTLKTEEDKQQMLFNAAEQIFYSNNYPGALVAFQDFLRSYPSSDMGTQADFYIAECYKYIGDKEHACDMYAKVRETPGKLQESAARQYADINYSLENYKLAYEAYGELLTIAKLPAMRCSAKIGMVRSAFKSKNFEAAVVDADEVLKDSYADKSEYREVRLMKALSLKATSRTQEAMSELAVLAQEPDTEEGARASYLLVQDSFDRADYKAVYDGAIKFSESGTSRMYWYAKTFILLGDSYAEQGKLNQARATFQSIADEYRGDDDILSEVRLRLDKLDEMISKQ